MREEEILAKSIALQSLTEKHSTQWGPFSGVCDNPGEKVASSYMEAEGMLRLVSLREAKYLFHM